MQRPEAQTIPTTPGVYIFKNAQGRILYVGKARILRKRLMSYFREDGLPAKTKAMLRHAISVETLSTNTEKEALLLESSLIKKHRPHYNIVLRDDKQYVLFKISSKHPYPRLEVVRTAKRDKAMYFGPFTSAQAARETWKLLHKAFPLRRCTDRAMQNRSRPCLYHFMGQCPAPCMNLISPQDYAQGVQRVAEVLAGRSGALLQELELEMHLASEAQEYERAAVLRDQVRSVKRTVERQAAVLPGGANMDVVGLYAAENGMALGILFVREGLLMDGRTFFWSGLDFEDSPELMISFLAQFYGAITPPARIVLPWIPKAEDAEIEAEDSHMLSTLAQSLGDIRGGAVRIVAAKSVEENGLVDMASANAREEALRRKGQSMEERLAKALHLQYAPRRIECVDVSHTSGKQNRVGMVVFEDGKAQKSAYRSYAMPDSADDYATLAAWVLRRLDSGPPWPDLLLIDGGKGQLNVVQRALKEAGKEGLFASAAIAKARHEDGRSDRRAGNISDRIFLPERSNPLPLREGAPELLFLQYVRDCTHSFALGRHRTARTGAALSSELMRIPGVGLATAKLLWQHFSSLEAMRKATLEDLIKIPSIGKAKAKSLQEQLKKL